ncbi:hypothetical protein [Lysinibacillus sp. 54212]
MKLGKIVKTAMRWAPVVYPVVKKAIDSKKASPIKSATTRKK